MPQKMVVIAFVIVCVATSAVGGDAEASIDDLAWMAGHWSGNREGVQSEEGWFAPKGGLMLGVHRDVAPGSRAFFEYLRIEERDGSLVYVASPMGGRATEFRLVEMAGQSVVFENLEHDFPQRIVYARHGNELEARAEGMVKGKKRSERWVWELKP
jgi:hypothetical protein